MADNLVKEKRKTCSLGRQTDNEKSRLIPAGATSARTSRAVASHETSMLQGGLESASANAYCNIPVARMKFPASGEDDTNEACEVAIRLAAFERQVVSSSQLHGLLFAHHIIKGVCLLYRGAEVDETDHFDRLDRCTL